MKLCEACGEPIPKRKMRASKPNRFCSWDCFKATPRPQLVETPIGTRMMRRPDHPLAPPKSGLVALSRIVLYEKIGPGEHPCTWCERKVTWMPGAGNTEGALIADHLDWNQQNNDPSNLVPSCHVCNSHRVRQSDRRLIEEHEIFLVDSAGERHRAEEKVCEYCGSAFLAKLTFTRRRAVRFCSLPCANRGNAKTRNPPRRPTSSPSA